MVDQDVKVQCWKTGFEAGVKSVFEFLSTDAMTDITLKALKQQYDAWAISDSEDP